MGRCALWFAALILGMFVVMSTPLAAFSTAIAVVRVPSKVVIAADSRVVDDGGKQMPDECKIRVVESTVYTAHGMSTHASTGFDLFRFVSVELRRPGDISSVAVRVGRSATGPLTEALTELRKASQTAFRRATRGAALGVILARHEDGVPQLASIRLFAHSDSNDGVQIVSDIRICPGSDCLGGVAAIWVSSGDDRLAFQRAHPEYWKEDLPTLATAFVQGEIDRGLPDVGPPIDVIQIVGGEIVWVHRKKGCVGKE